MIASSCRNFAGTERNSEIRELFMHADASKASAGKCVSLPVLSAGPRPRIRRWRTATLIGVNVLILGHVAHWAVSGRTLSPAVMSDTMKTLEVGHITCGVIIFGLALAVSLVAGRFLCGWACHMGALQDLCGWALRKTGRRPAPLRSRWLGYVPLALAVYMFVWPTLRREVLAPLLSAWWPEALAWIGAVHPFPGLSNRLITDDFWDGLPTRWYVIAPFLLVCGVASVYFLGARGLCRYGCPYAGLLDPAEKLAPISIVLDPARCDQCGKCTAACEVGVRVMDEVNQYGSVVNSRCIRSLDCLSVCPQQALSLGVGVPAAVKGLRGQRPKEAYSLSLGEELLATGAGLLTFFAARSAYGLVPMLMAVGLGICTAAASVAIWRVAGEENVRFIGLQLNRAGRVRAAGWAVAAAMTAWGLLLAQAGAVRVLQARGAAIASGVPYGPTESLAEAPVVSEADREAAERAAWWLRLAGPLADGGVGLAATPEADVRAAWLNLVAGHPAVAQGLAERAVAREQETDELGLLIATALARQGDLAGAEQRLAAHVRTRPVDRECRQALVGLLIGALRVDEAVKLMDGLAAQAGAPGEVHAERARLLAACEQFGLALGAIRRAAELSPTDVAIATDQVAFEAIGGDGRACAAAAERLHRLAGAESSQRLASLAAVLEQGGMGAAAALVRASGPTVGGGKNGVGRP